MPAYGTRIGKSFVAIAFCLSLALAVLGTVPNTAAVGPSDQSVSACAHVLSAGQGNTGPTVECFVNATASFSFEPNRLTVPANATVVFTVGNIGGLPHTFTLDSVANDSQLATWTASPSGVASSALSAYFSNHSALNLYVNGSGPYTSSPVALAEPHGIYYFVCLVAGHFQQGMFGGLYMGLSAPPPVVQPAQPSLVQGTMLLIALVVIAVAAILLMVVMVRGPPAGGRGSRPASAEAPKKTLPVPSKDSES